MSYLYMENWDSQTVFGGETMENPEFSFDPWSNFQLKEDDLINFPELFQPNNPNVLDDQFEQQIYTPFYPDQLINNPYSMPVLEDHHVAEEEEIEEEEPEINRKRQQSVSVSAKPKRFSRKNQQNRVVRHVTADDLQSDTWAWRKYGQKPIKGSPYPRSYYRCSSLKGCLARKQVERSCSDPKIFIITYTAEHSHGHPTRRNSLSGSTRNKSSVTKSVADNKKEARGLRIEEDDETAAKQEESMRMEELHRIEDVDEKDKVLCDELIQSFEGFEGLLDQDQYNFPDFSNELWSMDEESLQF